MKNRVRELRTEAGMTQQQLAAETVFVELKRPGQVERQRQLFVQAGLRKLGFKVFSAVDSPEKVQEVIDYCGRCEGGGGA